MGSEEDTKICDACGALSAPWDQTCHACAFPLDNCKTVAESKGAPQMSRVGIPFYSNEQLARECVCGRTAATNPDCERCRLVAEIRLYRHVLTSDDASLKRELLACIREAC